MSRRSARRGRLLFGLAVLLNLGGLGCWEQWSETWFPQMKWQRAIQAFERVPTEQEPGTPRIDPFLPPAGAVAIGAEASTVPQYDPAADAIANPTQPKDLHSLTRGAALYAIYCNACHGPTGMGDGPVSMANPTKPGPFAGVFPLVTAAARSDGYIYNLIRAGGQRMPSYQRISVEDRWHVVNYVRYLQAQVMGGQS